MKGHVWFLSFPIVKGNASNWTNNFDHHSILVTIFRVDEQLECVEQEHDAHEGEGRWQQVAGTKVLLGVQVEAWEEPDDEEGQLEQDNVSIISLIERDLARPPDGPCY